IHLEIQAQRDLDFAKRMCRYHVRLFDRQNGPVLSLAVLADDDPHWRPDRFGYDIADCVLMLRFPTVKLWALDAQMLEASANPIATITLIHREAQATRHDPEERMRRKIARFRACLRQGYSAEDLRHLYRLLDQLMRLPPSIDEPVRATMRQIEQEERGMTPFVTSIERLAGAEGEARGERKVVLRLLERKLGSLSAALEAEVAALDTTQLDALSEALLSFTAQAHLAAWLQGQREGWDVAPFEASAYLQVERNMVLRLLKYKIGSLNETLETKIAELNSAQLDALSKALLDFTTQAELAAWLRGQGGGDSVRSA
ncbi:DUF4351 domain-containing protein, partial [Candidatus Viridilinea mediisalina]